MGLIPPPIPAAFLLFEVTSGLNFPFYTEHRGSLLGGWKRVSGPLLPPRLNTSKYCRSMSHWTRHCTILYPDPDSVLISPWWLIQTSHSCDMLANACFDCSQTDAISLTGSKDHNGYHTRDKVQLMTYFITQVMTVLLSARRKSHAHYSIGLYTKGCNTDETVWAASLWGNNNCIMGNAHVSGDITL